MGHDLATRAELGKLARALGTTPDGVAFAASLGAGDVRVLRDRVVAALYDEHRAAFRRVAAITRMLPTALNVRITLRAFSPLLAARVAGEMAPDRAAELANRMPIEYLAEGCVHLDPRRAGPLIRLIRRDRVVAVVGELVARGDFITLGRLLDEATDDMLAGLAETLPDEALLRIGRYTESAAHLTRAVAALSPDRLRRIVHTALTGPPDLRSAGLAVISRLENDALRGRLAAYAAELDDETLTALLGTALADDAVGELLAAAAAMDEDARRRVVGLPVLADAATRARLTDAAVARGLWPLFAPLIEH
jgi:hypothetical protein